MSLANIKELPKICLSIKDQIQASKHFLEYIKSCLTLFENKILPNEEFKAAGIALSCWKIIKEQRIPKEGNELQEINSTLIKIATCPSDTGGMQIVSSDRNTVFYPEFLRPLFLALLQASKESFIKFRKFILASIEEIDEKINDSWLNRKKMAETHQLQRLIIKLIYKCAEEALITSRLLKLLTRTAEINISNSDLKKYFSKLQLIEKNVSESNVDLLQKVLESTRDMLSRRFLQKGFFLFDLSLEGGMVLSPLKLPREGFCVFGWIQIEKVFKRHMCLFYFTNAKREKQMKLWINEDGSINYNMAEKGVDLKLTFLPTRLNPNEWNFLEFYHTNESERKVTLFLNGSEVSRLDAPSYYSKNPFSYDACTIGCVKNQTTITSDFKLDTYSEVFVGQISALHFISTDSSRVTSTHNFLSITYPYLSMQDLIAFTLSPTTFEAPIEYRARLQKAKGFDNNFLIKFPEKIFLVINPKYESRTHVKDEPLYIIGKQQEYLNPISEILKGTVAYHNHPAIEVLMNSGGIKSLFYIINILSHKHIDSKAASIAMETIFTIFISLLAANKQRATIILQQENGILLLRHLLEKLSKKLSGGSVFSSAYKVYESLVSFSYDPAIIDKFLEYIILNADIWKRCSNETQEEFINKAEEIALKINDKKQAAKIFDYLLACIEIYVNPQDIEQINKGKIMHLSKLLMKIKMDEAMISKFVGYINIFYIRRQGNYLLQLFYMMRIMLKLFIKNYDEFKNEAFASLKKKQECKLLSSLFLILDYCLFLKESGGSAEYRGIPSKPVSKKNQEDLDDPSPEENVEKMVGNLATSEFIKSQEGIYTLDCIIGMCLFILVNFPWSHILDTVAAIKTKADKMAVKEEEKESSKVIKAKYYFGGLDLAATILSEHNKSLQKNAMLFVISYWFGIQIKNKDILTDEQKIGKATYSALFCTALDAREMKIDPFNPSKKEGMITFFMNVKREKPIKSLFILNFIFVQLKNNCFSEEAKKGLLADLIFICTEDKLMFGEFLKNLEIITNILTLHNNNDCQEVVYFQSIFLWNSMLAGRSFLKNYVEGDSKYKLELVGKLLDQIFDFIKAECRNSSIIGETAMNNNGNGNTISIDKHLLQDKDDEEKKKHVKPKKLRELLFPHIPRLIEIYYFVEDLLSEDIALLKSAKINYVFSKLIILAYKMGGGFLYWSIPPLGVIDERLVPFCAEKEESCVMKLDKQEGEKYLPREGGIMRILFKFFFLANKFDTSPSNSLPIAYLKFYLFKDKEAKSMIYSAGMYEKKFKTDITDRPISSSDHQIADSMNGYSAKPNSMLSFASASPSGRPIMNYCLFDLILKDNQEIVKSHAGQVENIMKVHFTDEQSFLDRVKISKNIKSVFSKCPNLFETPTALLMYIFSNLFQILHYNILTIQSYWQMQEDHSLDSLSGLNQKTYNKKFLDIVDLIYDILVKRTISNSAQSKLIEDLLFGSSFQSFLESIKSKYITNFPKVHGVTLYSIYSILDCVVFKAENNMICFSEIKQDKGKAQVRDPKAIIESFKDESIKIWSEIFKLLKPDKPESSCSTAAEIIHKFIAMPIFYDLIQPNLIFLTTNQLYTMDCSFYKYFSSSTHKENKTRQIGENFSDPTIILLQNESPEMVKLRENIVKYFCRQSISKEKIERDDLRAGFLVYGNSQLQSYRREMKSETGIYHNHKSEQNRKAIFAYFDKLYKKMISKCPFSEMLRKKQRALSNPWHEFVTLKSSRDNMLRAMKLKPMKKIQNNLSLQLTLKYARKHVLKKFLLLSLINEEEKKKELYKQRYLASDFASYLNKILKPIYHTQTITKNDLKLLNPPNNKIDKFSALGIPEKKSVDYSSSVHTGESSEDSLSQTEEQSFISSIGMGGTAEAKSITEYIPKNYPQFKAELITIKGAIYGKLYLNSMNLSFKSEPRKQMSPEAQKKYRFGPNEYVWLNVNNYNKKWAFSSINEIIVKRYNLIRQAVEIYFTSNKSLFFCFYTQKRANMFLKVVKSLKGKKTDLNHIKIVDMPEETFSSLSYTSLWINGELSNFEYLQYLNKYGGRSFNDLNQYPVFPWILQDYESLSLSQTKEQSGTNKIYRSLRFPIAAITEEKRKLGDEKLSVLIQESNSSIPPYQFGSHYLPGRVVLGFLLRQEPYTTLLIKFEKGQDAASRMFHIMKTAWHTCCVDPSDNKELIPEFFYFPEFFVNHNNYSYGKKNPEDDAGKMLKANKKQIMVDQVVLPEWANSHHEFIKTQSLALENIHSSLNLHHWINLIFGERQQDQHAYNRFKTLCDEVTVRKKIDEIDENNITEIQEFGSNPIKLFRFQHPEKKVDILRKKTQYSLFENIQNEIEKNFSIIKLADFTGSPIIRIYANEIKGPVIAVGQQKMRIFRSKPSSDINAPLETSIVFSPSNQQESLRLFPMKKIYSESQGILNWDAARCIIIFSHGELIATCRHFDNTIRIINSATGEIKQTLHFHFEMVQAIAITKNDKWLYSGSADGVIAKWSLEKLASSTLPSPICWNCDHNSYITTMDTSHELDLVGSGSYDGTIALRTISTGKMFRVIKVFSGDSNKDIGASSLGYIYMIRFSYRGYIVVVIRSNTDTLMVYSINGELVCKNNTDDVMSAIIVDELGYRFVAAGLSCSLWKYDLLTLTAKNMLEELDEKWPIYARNIKEFLAKGSSITSLALTKQENCQQLVIGMNNGSIFTYKISPRLLSSKVTGILQDFIAGSKK